MGRAANWYLYESDVDGKNQKERGDLLRQRGCRLETKAHPLGWYRESRWIGANSEDACNTLIDFTEEHEAGFRITFSEIHQKQKVKKLADWGCERDEGAHPRGWYYRGAFLGPTASPAYREFLKIKSGPPKKHGRGYLDDEKFSPLSTAYAWMGGHGYYTYNDCEREDFA
jgi:hypothetical protein